MMFPAIAWRELAVQARQPGMFWQRLLISLVTVGVVVVIMVVGDVVGALRTAGAQMFWILSWLGMVYCLFEGLRQTVDCLSVEKREGTLGLLMLTEVLSLDVVLGKWVVRALAAGYQLLAMFPALAMPLVLGGTTGGEWLRMVLALFNALFFGLAVGMWVSAWGKELHGVWAAGLGWLTGLVFLPGILDLAQGNSPWGAAPPVWGMFSPLMVAYTAKDSLYAVAPAYYWRALVATHLLGWLLLAGSALILRRTWRWMTEGRTSEWAWPLWGQWPGRLQQVVEWLEKVAPWARPVTYLERGLREHRAFLGIFLGLLGGGMVAWMLLVKSGGKLNAFCWAAVGVFWVLHWLLRIWATVQACYAVGRLRRAGWLELLMVAPLAKYELPWALMQAQSEMPRLPFMMLALMECAGWMMMGLMVQGANKAMVLVLGGFAWAAGLAVLWLDLRAVTYAGLWFSLNERRTGMAVWRTLGWVLVAPLALVVLLPLGLWLCGVGLPLIFMFKSSVISQQMQRRLTEQFSLAVQRGMSGGLLPARWGGDWTPPKVAPPPLAQGVWACVSCGQNIAGLAVCPYCGYQQPYVRGRGSGGHG